MSLSRARARTLCLYYKRFTARRALSFPPLPSSRPFFLRPAPIKKSNQPIPEREQRYSHENPRDSRFAHALRARESIPREEDEKRNENAGLSRHRRNNCDNKIAAPRAIKKKNKTKKKIEEARKRKNGRSRRARIYARSNHEEAIIVRVALCHIA